jgi:two-component system sensor histidine kinase and response regulator WspE
VTLRIEGELTQVDRDLLGRLDAPLGHLLRNAIDHGIETPDERRAAGKPEEGTVCLEAHHVAGRLHIILSDDGRGVDLERLRDRIVARNLLNAEAARALSEAELLEFLFLPAFTLKDTVSDISGRGVGLDAVRDMVRRCAARCVRPQRRAAARSSPAAPVILPVLVIGGEPYAFPLSSVTERCAGARPHRAAGRPSTSISRTREVASAHQVLGVTEPAGLPPHRAVVVVGDGAQACGVIGPLRGERDGRTAARPVARQDPRHLRRALMDDDRQCSSSTSTISCARRNCPAKAVSRLSSARRHRAGRLAASWSTTR